MSQANGTETARFERDIVRPEFPLITVDYLPANVNLTFYMTPHVTAEHFDEGAEHLAAADVFVPELVAWDDNSLRQYNAVSKGDSKVFGKLTERHTKEKYGEYSQALIAALYNTWKPVVFIDADHTRKDLLMGKNQNYEKAVSSDVESTLDRYADTAARIAEISLARDAIMIENLGTIVSAVVTSNPRLSIQEQVNILLSLGVIHSAVYEVVAASSYLGDRSAVYYWNNNTDLTIEGKIVDMYKRGQTPTYTDFTEFLVKSALSMIGIPSVQTREGVVYDFDSVYKREPELQDAIGERMARNIIETETEGLDICRKVVRSIKPSKTEMEFMRDAYLRAQLNAV